MLPPRPARILVLVALCLGLDNQATAQDDGHTVVSSGARHVTLEKGTSVTLKTLALPFPFADNLPAVPAGQFLQAVLAQKISGKTAKVGDEVRFSVLYPFHFQTNSRTVQVPRNATIQGHITRVAERDGNKARAQLAFRIDRLVCPDESVLLNAVAIDVNRAPVANGFGTQAGQMTSEAGSSLVCHTCADPARSIDRVLNKSY